MDIETQPKAILLDLFKSDLNNKEIVKTLEGLELDSVTLVCVSANDLSLEDVKSHLRTSNLHKDGVQMIVNKDKLSAFFSAKKFLDLNGINQIKIVCLGEDTDYWNVVGDLFFTPVHNWKIESSVDKSEEFDKDQMRKNILNDASIIIHNLPSEGVIKTFHSKLIPDDIFYHGFNSRSGGISYVPGMKSLNLVYTNTKTDPRIFVKENRLRLANYVGFDEESLHIAHTVHGKDVHVVGNEIKDGGHDGVISNQPNVTLGAPGADCITTLFADPVQRACGAAHAGWKGTLSGITTEMIKLMECNFKSKSEDILVVMGPSIGKCCFEFGEEESKWFSDIDPTCVVRQEGQPKPFIDLQKVNRILLERHGVKPHHIDDTSVTMCTSCNPELFFSFRRDGRPFGNQIGFIGIK